MTRSVFLDRDLPEAEAGAEVPVASGVAHHIRVSRIAADEEFDLVDGEGRRLRVVLAASEGPDARQGAERAGPRSGRRRSRTDAAGPLAVRVVDVAHEQTGAPELVLVQALAKADRDEQAIESATEIGVDRVVPWAAARSIAAWPAHKEEKQASRWQALLDSATQQSRRARAPRLEPLARGRRVRETLRDDDLVLVLHEDATEHLADVLESIGSQALGDRVGRIVLVVGPEGGISPEELDGFRSAGARLVLLGPTVLRASSAGPAGLALVQVALGRWRSKASPRR
ncbi:16S rRNA (uracil(1498)-N(3))-methyltransferase [Brevibacterium jeotgali]|uniref:Ribosomal RNA small subunit methyltransferase E n=1 Tax=Brevibacterium jeotgali TaxID=1262550 RepID=A0A2H1L290_9MICO|nr:16S rRNA (uracil(1498)-N(3))-methyltransferase [Brevibacterium jeotgali]TWC02993.1 16S rRNA (uracil1498-N3)-methyltransferase [Brevibacterium jeotgali]SMY11016.1 16S rRNA (uracil1498-N3)-methyltransferase [Brevibacterium jeotgali]